MTRSARRRVGAFHLLVAMALPVSGGASPEESPDFPPAEMARLAPKSLLLDAATIADVVVVVGERGHILRSTGGSDWTQVAVPTRRMLTAATSDDNTMWAVGHDAIILRSMDRGTTWTEQFSAPEDEAPLFDVWTDGSRVIAVGAYGLTLVSDDGAEFEFSAVGTEDDDFHIYGLSSADDGVLYAAGEFGMVSRSTDRGDTWTRLATPYTGTYFGVLALGDGGVLVFGLRGNCFRSHDRGDTWRKIDTHTTAGLLTATRLDDSRLLVVGLSGALLISMDDGRSFIDHSRSDRLALTDIVELAPDRWLLLGEAGVLSVAALSIR